MYCVYPAEDPDLGGPEKRYATLPSLDGHLSLTPGQFAQRLGGPAPEDQSESLFRSASRQMPRLVGEYVADHFSVASQRENGPAGTLPTTSTQRLSALQLPHGGLVFCLTLDFDGDLTQVVHLLHATTFDWRSGSLDGQPLEARATQIAPVQVSLDRREVGLDVHRVLMVAPNQVPIIGRLDEAGAETGTPPARSSAPGIARRRQARSDRAIGSATGPADHTDRAVAETLVFGTLEPIRSSHAGVEYPEVAGQPGITAVAAGDTGLWAVGSSESDTGAQILWSIVLLASSQTLLRRLRREAFELRSQHHETRATSASPNGAEALGRLEGLTRRLARLESELALGVQANVDADFLAPSPALRHYHTALASLIGLPTSAQTISYMLQAFGKAVAGEREALTYPAQ